MLAMFTIFANISVSAADFTVGYLEYDVISFDDMTCEIVGHTSDIPRIPASISVSKKAMSCLTCSSSPG